jgi:hypothetical protein
MQTKMQGFLYSAFLNLFQSCKHVIPNEKGFQYMYVQICYASSNRLDSFLDFVFWLLLKPTVYDETK